MNLAIAGVGNNITALVQGVYYYQALASTHPQADLPGIRRPVIDDIPVDGLDFVAAYDVTAGKVGADLAEAIFAAPNNYPRLEVRVPTQNVVVEQGVVEDGDRDEQIERIAKSLSEAQAEVLLYSLPAGRKWAAEMYAEAALAAGVALVNCTPDVIARDRALLARYTEANLPLVGDDLASHFGTSVVHKSLLKLLADRGLTLTSSYQFNLGGNQDFQNLNAGGTEKKQSKLNALSVGAEAQQKVHMMPFGYVPQLADQKVAHLNIEGMGWAGTPITVDLKLKVQDSSNAAGVIIDLVRFAAARRRAQQGGFVDEASSLLKSPPGTPA
jgi:myo-inositol-1-phosphate synthase